MTDMQFYTLIGTLNVMTATMGIGMGSKFIASFFSCVTVFWAFMTVMEWSGWPT